jgi:hypothetical protein
LIWLLPLEEYEVSFEYLPGQKQKNLSTVADDLFCLDIDSLKIQEEEEVLTLLSGSENNSISNIKLIVSMHTVLIFKEQEKSRIQD